VASIELDDEAAAAIAVLAHKLGVGAGDRKAPRRTEHTIGYFWPLYARAERSEVSSWTTKEGRMRLHVLPFFGHRAPSDITLALCDEYREWRLAQLTPRGRPPSLTTINRELEDLRRLLSWAKHRRYIEANPLSDVERAELLKTEDNVRKTIYEESTLLEILDGAQDALGDVAVVFRAFLLTKVDSGARRGELAVLQWPECDERNGIITILRGGKTGEKRETDWSERAIAAVRAMRDWQAAHGVPKHNRWVFVNPHTHDHYHPDTYTGWMSKVCTELGINGPDGSIWLHDARHTFATMAARAGVTQSDARAMIGHKTDSMWNRYHVPNRMNVLRAKERLRERRLQETDTPHHGVGETPPNRTE